MFATKKWKTLNNISGYIEAVFLKLGTTTVHHKRNEMYPIYPTQSNDGSEDNMGTMSVSSRTGLLSHFRGCKWDI